MPDGNGNPTLGEVYRLQKRTLERLDDFDDRLRDLERPASGWAATLQSQGEQLKEVKEAQKTLRNMLFGAFVTLIVQLIGGLVLFLVTS